jgi:uncharacterized protein YraI
MASAATNNAATMPHTASQSGHQNGVPANVMAPASQTFQTTGKNVRMRSGPGVNYPIVFTIVNAGSTVEVDCWEPGTPVNGDSTWYSAGYAGHGGDIAGYWLNTGHDPNPNVPECNVGNP